MKYLLVVLLSIACISTNAQTGIRGQIVDNSKVGLPYADVQLIDAADSSFVSGTNTNEKGRFTLETEPGTYLVVVGFLSYETRYLGPYTLDKELLGLGQIELHEQNLQLEEVVVATEKSQVEFKLDKRVFNIGKDLRNVGSNAADILDNIPSINVDIDGQITLRGSENVRILIDGKPSGLVRDGDANTLRQLQASMIEKVEIITNPSARYEAEGEVGIINIVLKKNKMKGLNGSVDLAAGYPENAAVGLNMNYRKKNLNLFTNLGARYRQSPGGGNVLQQFIENDQVISSFESEREHIRGGASTNAQLGLDYYLNPKSTLTFSGFYRYSDNDNEADLTYKDLNGAGEVISISLREDDEREIAHSVQGAFNFTRQFSNKDHKLTVDVNYNLNDDTEKSAIFQSDDAGSPDITQRVQNVEDESLIILQTDYVHPFNQEGKFETGIRASFRTVDNNFLVEQLNNDLVWEVFQGFNNEMAYLEDIYAAYAIYANKFGKLGYQAGLRTEYSDIRTELALTNEINPRDYLNFFPSAHLSLDISDKDQLQLSYSRRISRPRFRHLLPFYGYSDNRSIWQGNPDLNPEFTNSLEAGYLKYFEKGSLLTSVYYRHRKGLIQRITFIDSTDLIRTFPINLGTQDAFGLEFSLNVEAVKWLDINWNVNAYQAYTRGDYEGVNYDVDAFTLSTRLSLRSKFGQGWNAQSVFDYRAPRKGPQGKSLGRFAWDLGVSREVMNRKGVISLNVSDVLNTRIWQSITEEEDFYRESDFQWRVRSITLGFNYLINQERSKRSRRNRGEGQNGEEFEM